MAAPRIDTERLTLRPHRLDDFPAFAAFFESDASGFVGGPVSPRVSWFRFAGDVGIWDLMGYGGWAVEERATGAFVGQVALSQPPHFPERELGWTLFAGFEGRGYATEAARAARAHAYGVLGWTTLVSYVDPLNTRSAAVARRLGCVPDPAAARMDPEDLVFRHPAPETLQ